MTKQDAPTTTDPEFEAWWLSEQLKTFPKDRDRSHLAGWGLMFKDKAELAWQAARASSAAAQPVSLGELAEREIKDAIRAAYDLGREDGSESFGPNNGEQVAQDHGGALLTRLQTLPAPPAKPADTGEASNG